MKRKGMGFWRVQKSARECKRVRKHREIKEIDAVGGDGVAISRQSVA
jgi:hypothetical protein